MTRTRDAGRTRGSLLTAAAELFAERGYDGTTTRDIGERAGADPKLIARYFGSKAELYVAALRTDADPADLLDPDRLADLLRRVSARGAGPVLRAAVQRHDDATLQRVAEEALQERLVAPLAGRLGETDDAALRAELAVAAFAGIALGRTSGAFPALAAADETRVQLLTAALLEAVSAPSTAGAAPPSRRSRS